MSFLKIVPELLDFYSNDSSSKTPTIHFIWTDLNHCINMIIISRINMW